MVKKKCIFMLILSSLFLASCGSIGESVSEYDEPVIDVAGMQEEEQVIEINNDTSYNKYYKYMLSEANGKNAVFSSESLCSAFDMYSDLVSEEDKQEIDSFLNHRDYLSYENSDVFKLANRIWVNTNYDFNFESDLVYKIDMSDSSFATEEKNAYVSEKTDGFISSTPLILDNSVIFDVMNIVYFKDNWLGGEKEVKDFTFHNLDGTDSETEAIVDSSGILMKSNNAHGYKMTYENGFEFTAILPDEGIELMDVDINDFMIGNVDFMTEKPHFEMPEFETESTYGFSFDAFDLSIGPVREDIMTETGLADITQVAKIKVDREGTEAAAVTSIAVVSEAITDEPEYYDMICDKPFIYYIYDSINDDIAFIGVVYTI